MLGKNLLIYLPVLHRGYLDFLSSFQTEVFKIYLLPKEIISEYSKYEPDIAALDTQIVAKLLKGLGYNDISIFSLNDLENLRKSTVILVNDEVSRAFADKNLTNCKIEWQSVFLRWDRSKVLSTDPLEEDWSNEPQDLIWMKEAYQQGNNSSDWWRQVGAVLVKDGEVVLRSYNIVIPNDHSPYLTGGIRDYLEVGERPDLSPTIHAEQVVIAEAARLGTSLEGSSLYVTHFPCSVCAKLIAYSGISKLVFGEGSANLDGKKSLQMAKVEIRRVNKVE